MTDDLDALLGGAAVRHGHREVTAAGRARLDAALAALPAPGPYEGPGARLPSRAGVRDLLLGGRDHYAVDRLAAAELGVVWPDIARAAAALRAAVHATARHAVGGLGIRQVLVADYGYPTVGTSGPDLHTTVLRASPDANVVYLEPDPVAAAVLRAEAERRGSVTVLRADLAADPAGVLRRAVGDLGRPVCVLLPEALSRAGAPERIARVLARALVPGSVVMAAGPDDIPAVRRAAEVAARHLLPFHPRTTADLRALLGAAGLTWLEQGPLCVVGVRRV
ncbi:SAM-dependent methyltransferase [Streptomyces sp. MS19]|uniref:SAM-dependent methyltransferase n=1 Tax=Streptomyces sp. MS19 TaxID=3385972 RepID=UPI0039A174B7